MSAEIGCDLGLWGDQPMAEQPVTYLDAVRNLVVLRHSLTRKGRSPGDTGSHLSPTGVRRARALGKTLPAFAYVAVGDTPLHLETALALGCAVDEQVSWPSGYVAGEVDHHDQWSWPTPFTT
jgi:hypothetical protein